MCILFVSCHLSKIPKTIYYAYCNLGFDIVIMILHLYFYVIEIYHFSTAWILLLVRIMPPVSWSNEKYYLEQVCAFYLFHVI